MTARRISLLFNHHQKETRGPVITKHKLTSWYRLRDSQEDLSSSLTTISNGNTWPSHHQESADMSKWCGQEDLSSSLTTISNGNTGPSHHQESADMSKWCDLVFFNHIQTETHGAQPSPNSSFPNGNCAPVVFIWRTAASLWLALLDWLCWLWIGRVFLQNWAAKSKNSRTSIAPVFTWSRHNENSNYAITNSFLAWKHGQVVAAVLSRAQL